MAQTVCFDLRCLQMGHESRGIGMHVRSILEHLPANPEVSYIFYIFDENDPIVKLGIKVNAPYTLVKTKTVKKSIDHPKDALHLSKIILHRFEPLSISPPDVFVQFDLMLGLPQLIHTKTVLIAYDLIPLLFSSEYLPTPYQAFRTTPGRLQPFKKALRALYYRGRYNLHYKNFQKADQILAISEHTAKSLEEFLGINREKITTIPLAPVFNTSKPLKPKYLPTDSKPFLFYIGATDARKRVQDLVDAYNILRGRGYDIQLILAGKELGKIGKIPNMNIRHSIELSPYREGIVTLGYINDNEKLWLYQHALAFVFPTLHEGFGLPIIEAMQSGCAVISYNNSSIPEVAGDVARLVPTHDITGIVNQTMRIYDDQKFREMLQDLGPKQAQKYSWEVYIKSFFKAILEE
ncbi:MAG: glycosyltransferase family 1 protein [Candidatus Saccharimonadales bacterium]